MKKAGPTPAFDLQNSRGLAQLSAGAVLAPIAAGTAIGEQRARDAPADPCVRGEPGRGGDADRERAARGAVGIRSRGPYGAGHEQGLGRGDRYVVVAAMGAAAAAGELLARRMSRARMLENRVGHARR